MSRQRPARTSDPPGAPHWRRHGLLLKFVLILTPVFFILAVPSIGYLVHVRLQTDQHVLAARFGNQAARAAAALGRHDTRGNPRLAQDLLAPLAADRAFICAELRDGTGRIAASVPPAQGCVPVRQDTNQLVLPVREDDGSTLTVRFSDAELNASENLQATLAMSVVGLAYLIAMASAITGFRIIVARPLRLLLSSIERSARTGKREQVGLRRKDELGAVIEAFDGMLQREDERELALTDSNRKLQVSQADLQLLNLDLEKRVEERTRDLVTAKQRAEAADRAKSEFLAAVSHELRTPLNAIIGFSEVMANETLGPMNNPRYREYAVNINESGEHLLELINDILDLTKVEAGLDELHIEPIDVPALIESVVTLVQQRLHYGGLALELDLSDELPALQADKRKLKQILVNLLSNAIKFTDPGGRITVGVAGNADGGLLFRIADTGIGMAPSAIPKALSHFGQIDGDLNRKYQGTGLGLPLSKALVELHGGRLDLQSAVGVGTTVFVRLPASPPDTRKANFTASTHAAMRPGHAVKTGGS